VRGAVTGSGRSRPRSNWRATVELVAVLIPVAGLALFVLVRVYLNEFYGRLGVDPDEVGLSYAATLGGSVGLVIFVTIAVIVVPAVLIACAYAAFRVARSHEPLRLRDLPESIGADTLSVVRRTLPVGTAVAVVIFAVGFSGKAAHYAHAVQQGKAVRFGLLSLTSFKVRASPVRVEPIGDPAGNPAIVGLAQRAKRQPPLLYLGQADGSLVAYDSVTQEAVRVPASAVLLRVSNCEADPPVDAACRTAIH
jgi:hypothetical protein